MIVETTKEVAQIATTNQEEGMDLVVESQQALTRNHPLWGSFIDKLETIAHKQGADSTDLTQSRSILKGMDGIDIAGSLDYLRESGWYSDYEFLQGQGIGLNGVFTSKKKKSEAKASNGKMNEFEDDTIDQPTENEENPVTELSPQVESNERGEEDMNKERRASEAKVVEEAQTTEFTDAEVVQDQISAVEKIAHDPNIVKKRIQLVNDLGVAGEKGNIAVCAMAVDSRLLNHGSAGTGPILLILVGPSGTGKSHTKDKTLRLYTLGLDYEKLTSATHLSFFNLGDTLQHKLLDITEADFLKSDKKLVCVTRQLHSEGRISHQRTVRSDEGSSTERATVHGPIALMTSTTEGSVETQFDNRSIVIHTDTSRRQGRAISNRQALAVAGLANNVPEETIQAWRDFHACLETLDVIIPFAPRIDELIENQVHSTLVNRTLSQLYSSIMATTLVHQFQRSQDEQGRLIAEIADYAIVQQLLNPAFIEGMAGGSAAKACPKMQVINAARMIRPGDLADELGVSKAAITKWLNTDTGRNAVEWCDEQGNRFEDWQALSTAKHRGAAYLRALGGFGLPSAYEVSGDSDWQVGGRLYKQYDLELNG
ncbi:hypothetical protein SAMN06295888_1384 [Desulfonatronum zhilinae]|nr:hypothetical protein SAMN06295888_1384 [Desulfonatronum zhilinae]